MTILNNCPCCQGSRFEPFISCKDYTVSGERFTIVNCLDCSFKFTNPRPEDSVIGKYYKSEDYISHTNTKKGIVSKLYHLIRNYTLGKKEALLRKYVSRGTLLDYGCGTGMFLSRSVKLGWRAFGIEPDNGAREIAKKGGSVVFDNLDAFDIKMAARFDAITLWHVLEHVGNLSQVLEFFKGSLKEDGVLAIAVPNYSSYDARYYGEYWAAYDVPRHLYHFDGNTIQHLLASHGFELIEAHPMKFDSFYVSLLSEKYRSESSNLIKAFWLGLLSNLKARSATDYSSVIYVFKHA